MNVRDVVRALEAIAPLAHAEAWDNVGLLVGAREWPAERVLLTIDLTESVLEEAVARGAQMVVAYHPPIFEPLKRLTDDRPRERLLLEAAQAGLAIHSPHTALDAAPGGVNDWLAESVGAGDVAPIAPAESRPASEAFKLVTFCPESAAGAIRAAMSAAGAGRIGDYEQCSFETRGTGTFLGGAATRPAVGAKGRLERVEEARLEMVCAAGALGAAIAALRRAHPYEEPPIEVHALAARPHLDRGAGRIVALRDAAPLGAIAGRVKAHLGAERLLVATAEGGPEAHRTIGVCAGAGGSLLAPAVGRGATVFLTGEMRHHDVLAATASGCSVILAGHTTTERGYLPRLAERLGEALPDLEIMISKRDRDPLAAV
jgi:dinuclear metal center YbgI/SA1388 family protein